MHIQEKEKDKIKKWESIFIDLYTNLFPNISCKFMMVSSSSLLKFPLLMSGLR